MARKTDRNLFDDLMKVISVGLTYTGVNVASIEIDFDIPRGFVVEIHRVVMQLITADEDIEGISVDKIIRYVAALVLDPDDATSTFIPNNTVVHDVLMEYNDSTVIIAGTAGDTGFKLADKVLNFDFSAGSIDVVTARNMRLNVDTIGTDAADATEAQMSCIIYYTLEKITDDLLLSILDIL